MDSRVSALMVGAGGWAGFWINQALPRFQDRLNIVGLVDANEATLKQSADVLQLSGERTFGNMEEAFRKTRADMAIIVVPPAFHKEAVMRALDQGMAILSEKPISDSWDATVDIYRAVRASNAKMAVIQNYRYIRSIRTLKAILDSNVLGRTNYIVSRFAADYRERGSWGKFRHEIPHALLIEGGVHHLDQLRNLSGSDCSRISGFDWNPRWSSFDGDCCGLFVMEMENGVRAVYEGSCTAVGSQNSWHEELYRVECEHGVAVLGKDQGVRIERHVGQGKVDVEDIPLIDVEYEGHQAIIDFFLDWLHGGPAPETQLDDNIKSAAMLFGAIHSSETGSVVHVPDMLAPLVDRAND